jgi:hypothetical protein
MPGSNQFRGQQTDPLLPNNLQFPRGQFSSSIEMHRLAKEEPNVPNSSSGNKADFRRRGLEELRDVGISKPPLRHRFEVTDY